jgi:signal peptidase II
VLAPLALVLLFDRLTKAWVLASIWSPPRDVGLVPGWLELTPVANRGIAFGVMQESGGVLALVAVAVLGIVALRSWRQLVAAPLWIRIALGLIGGGAVGNVIDRFLYGFVVDFVHVPPIWLFQVFNIADASICVGAAILALALFVGDRRPRKKAEPGGAPS